MEKIKKKVNYTNGVPLCPECEKPTKRSGGVGSITCAYYPPVYDENGVNTNPDRNIRTSTYHCHECGCDYVVRGNNVNGYSYEE